MALGLSYSANDGNIVPIVKYDARAGRIFRVDRADGVNTPVDITRQFKAVIDFENTEIGWMRFAAGAAPDFQLVPFGQIMGDRPTPDYKQGVRLMLKLSQECGGDVRELAGAAGAFLRAIDELHTAYLAGEKNNPGKLPVVVLKDTIPITSGQGAQKSTNYQPVFEITGWVPRPKDLVFVPKAIGRAAASAPAAPPATGSTRVDPPAARPAEPVRQPAMAEDDFG